MSKPVQSSSYSVPAPIGGLNALDSMAAMAETDAIVMRNFYPQSYGVAVRKGFKTFANGMSGTIGTLMRHNGISGNQVLFAVDDDWIYNITAGGTMTATEQVAPSTNKYWQYTDVANTLATYIMAFNGTDDGFLYTESSGYMALVAGDGTTDGTWKNVDPKVLIQPIVHQHRVWAVEKDSTIAWYLPSEQLWGVATAFDFGGNYNRGGYLQALATWTVDSGLGPNDYLAAISSAGEVALYQGTDPNSVETWKLIGVFYVGGTFTRRCWTKFGGDVAFLTQFGMLTLNAVLKPDPGYVLGNPLSQKIQRLISQVILASYEKQDWDIHNFASENMLIINVPGLDSTQNIQLAYNTITRAWTLFDGMHASCWMTTRASIFFGEDGRVCLAWHNYLDNVAMDDSGGENIVAECQQAFSYFGMPGVLKHYKMMRPTFLHGSMFKHRVGANMNFDFTTSPPPASTPYSDFGIWDTALWDTTAQWAGGVETDKQWSSVVGLGFAAAPRVAVEANSEVVWIATDWLMEKGGVV